MRVIRCYQATPLVVNTTVALQPHIMRHVITVLRLKLHDQFMLFNGDGFDYTAQIVTIERKQVLVQIIEQTVVTNESAAQIHLAPSISKSQHFELMLQKVCELGVTSITPIISTHCEHTVLHNLEKKHQRWQEIIISATEQSGRAYLPILNMPQDFNNFLAHTSHQANTLNIILDPYSNDNLHSIQNTLTTACTVLIGAEGGFSTAEITAAKHLNWHNVNLGKRILRTETASIAALAVLQFIIGDL